MEKYNIKIITIIILFLGIYAFNVIFLPFSVAKIISLVGLGVLFLVITKNKKVFSLSKKSLIPFALIIFLIIYSLIMIFIQKTYDISMSYAFGLFFVEHLPIVFLIIFLLKKDNNFSIESFFKLVIWICLVQTVVILLMYFFDDFALFIINLTYPSRIDIYSRYGGIRGLGLTATASFTMSVVNGFVLMFIVYLLPKAKTNKKIIFYSISFFVITLTALLAGRIAYIGIFFATVMLIISFFKNRLNKKIILKFILFIIIIISALGLFFFNFSNKKLFSKIFVDTNLYVLEPFYSIFEIEEGYSNWLKENHYDHGDCTIIRKLETNNLMAETVIGESIFDKTNSTKILKDMYFKVTDKQLVLGDALYVDEEEGTYYKETDAGYMRHILFYGLVGSFSIYLFYIILCGKSMRLTIKDKNYFLSVLLFFLFLYMFIAHIKGDILMGGGMAIKIIFIVYFIIQEKHSISKGGDNHD